MTTQLGTELRKVRKERGISMRVAAEQIGCAVSTVHHIEHGGDPRWSVAWRVFEWINPREVTVRMCDVLLEQVVKDREQSMYWMSRYGDLDAVDAYVGSLRDWLTAQ